MSDGVTELFRHLFLFFGTFVQNGLSVLCVCPFVFWFWVCALLVDHFDFDAFFDWLLDPSIIT